MSNGRHNNVITRSKSKATLFETNTSEMDTVPPETPETPNRTTPLDTPDNMAVDQGSSMSSTSFVIDKLAIELPIMTTNGLAVMTRSQKKQQEIQEQRQKAQDALYQHINTNMAEMSLSHDLSSKEKESHIRDLDMHDEKSHRSTDNMANPDQSRVQKKSSKSKKSKKRFAVVGRETRKRQNEINKPDKRKTKKAKTKHEESSSMPLDDFEKSLDSIENLGTELFNHGIVHSEKKEQALPKKKKGEQLQKTRLKLSLQETGTAHLSDPKNKFDFEQSPIKINGQSIDRHDLVRKVKVFLLGKGLGDGLESVKRIPKGDVICHYHGKISETYKKGSHYSMKVGDVYVDSTHMGNIARYANHSEHHANAKFVLYELDEPMKIKTEGSNITISSYMVTEALRDIEPGEAILVNYNNYDTATENKYVALHTDDGKLSIAEFVKEHKQEYILTEIPMNYPGLSLAKGDKMFMTTAGAAILNGEPLKNVLTKGEDGDKAVAQYLNLRFHKQDAITGEPMELIDRDPLTALIFACYLGDIENVEYCLKQGAPPDRQQAQSKQTALFFPLKGLEDGKCTAERCFNIIKLLITYGANTRIQDKQSNMFLYAAIKHLSAEQIDEIIIKMNEYDILPLEEPEDDVSSQKKKKSSKKQKKSSKEHEESSEEEQKPQLAFDAAVFCVNVNFLDVVTFAIAEKRLDTLKVLLKHRPEYLCENIKYVCEQHTEAYFSSFEIVECIKQGKYTPDEKNELETIFKTHGVRNQILQEVFHTKRAAPRGVRNRSTMFAENQNQQQGNALNQVSTLENKQTGGQNYD